MSDDTFLAWLKARNANWLKQGNLINLANSGLAGSESILFRHMTEHPEEYLELLGAGHANEWGHEGLIERIRRHSSLSSEQEVLPVAGASLALWLANHALLSPGRGDRALVETPAYGPLFDIPHYQGVPVDWLPRDPERGYGIDLDGLRGRMTPRTKLIVLSNRHNPSGSALSNETLLALAEEAQRVSSRVRILVDETYSLLGSHKPAALLGRCFLSVGSLSKVYGLGLLRCGWLVGSPDVMNPVRTAWLHTMNIGSKLTEALAALTLDHLDEYAGHWREVVSVNRGIVREALEGLGDLVQGDIPPDSCVCFPRVHVPEVDRFVEGLESRGKVVVAPGRFFRAPRHVRIGFGGDTAKLKQGMDRIAESIRREAKRTEYGC